MNSYEMKQEARRERLENAAGRAQRESDAAFKRSHDLVSGIPLGQPILVGHHSEKRHRRAVDRSWDALGKGVEAAERAKELAYRAAAVGSGGISQDDPDAVAKLREKLAGEVAQREQMKAANVAYRLAVKYGVAGQAVSDIEGSILAKIAQGSGLAAVGREAARLALAIQWKPAYSFEKGPFSGWPLSNLGANIKRIEQRIANLEQRAKVREALAAEGVVSTETVVGAVRVVENIDANRLQVFFPGKPSAEIRGQLKSNGFRWAPSEGAWQRHLSESARQIAVAIARSIGFNGGVS